ncbi:MAG: prepilin peptidase [Bryobacterales bacterium]|nr:prepilin peptidase [Bryobacteraceae bacterium]MDW8131518.1 prepilin peptidase [Bryobacterales bacterium]
MLEVIAASVAGLLVGSFLNVCIYRLPRDLSVVQPRSFCPCCGAAIAWRDNIPLLSFLLLGGRCRACGARIPWRYPAVELATAALFVAAALAFAPFLEAIKFMIFSALTVGLIVTDLESRILPDEFTLGGAVLGVALAPLAPMQAFLILLFAPLQWGARWLSLGEAVLGALIAPGLLFAMAALYEKVRKREGMGLGDVKMAAMLGAFLGLQGALLALLIGSLLGSVVGLLYIKARHKKVSEYELPFGSFLGAGGLAVAFFSPASV